jgi:hypothetical protein
MNTFRNFLIIMAIYLLTISCEKETKEHFQISDDPAFQGFISGIFTVHENSIGYYFPDSNKVFPDLFLHQNGRGLGNGIHTFSCVYEYGLATIEKENRLEFISTRNFISTGSLELFEPRNICKFSYYDFVSFGKRNSGGIALVDKMNKKIIKTIETEIEPGKLLLDSDFMYLFSSGNDDRDSVIVRFYGASYPAEFHRIDSIVIGNRPVDAVPLILNDAHYHKGLAILCLGKKNVPPSVVILDLITGKINHTYRFENPDLRPESIFWIEDNTIENAQILVTYANNKLYRLDLSDPIIAWVYINKNISSLTHIDHNYIAVSRDTIHSVSYLYKIDFQSLEVFDSIPIEPRAKEIERIQY